jgi:hypothetical protein
MALALLPLLTVGPIPLNTLYIPGIYRQMSENQNRTILEMKGKLENLAQKVSKDYLFIVRSAHHCIVSFTRRS